MSDKIHVHNTTYSFFRGYELSVDGYFKVSRNTDVFLSDDLQRSTANNTAVTSADVADVRSDAPDDASEGETHRVAAESDSPADSRSEGEQSRGDRVDVTV